MFSALLQPKFNVLQSKLADFTKEYPLSLNLFGFNQLKTWSFLAITKYVQIYHDIKKNNPL